MHIVWPPHTLDTWQKDPLALHLPQLSQTGARVLVPLCGTGTCQHTHTQPVSVVTPDPFSTTTTTTVCLSDQ